MAADVEVGASVFDVLEVLHSCIDRLQDLDPTVLSSAEAVEALRETDRAARRLPSVRSALVPDIDSRGLAGQHGCRSTAALVRQLLGWSAAEAGSVLAQADDLVPKRSLSTGQLLPPRLPALAAAVAEGGGRRGARAGHSGRDAPHPGRGGRAHPGGGRTQPRAGRPGVRPGCAAEGVRQVVVLSGPGRVAGVDGEGTAGSARVHHRPAGPARHVPGVRAAGAGHPGALLTAALEPLAAPRHTQQQLRDPRTVAQRMHDALRDAAKLLLGGGWLPSQAGTPATLLPTCCRSPPWTSWNGAPASCPPPTAARCPPRT
jgi:Domain of unknown function (DUF222)